MDGSVTNYCADTPFYTAAVRAERTALCHLLSHSSLAIMALICKT
jgi:hypothetical protein